MAKAVSRGSVSVPVSTSRSPERGNSRQPRARRGAFEQGPEGGHRPGDGETGGGQRHEAPAGGSIATAQCRAREVSGEVAVEREQEEGDQQERHFLRAEGEGEGGGVGDQPARPSVVQVAPEGGHREQREEGEVDVHAQEAAVVDGGRGEGEEGPGGERAPRTQPAAQGEGRGHHAHAEEGGRDARGVVRGRPDEEGEALHDVEEGAMVDGAVAVVPLREIPGPLGVDALVVVEGARAEVPEAQGDGDGEDDRPENDLPVQGDAPREKGGGVRHAGPRHSGGLT